MRCITDYVGFDYPLSFDVPEERRSLQSCAACVLILVAPRVRRLDSLAVRMALMSARYDVTVLVCSYNRVQNLRVIIHALMCGQDFAGDVEILVCDNNPSKSDAAQSIVRTFATRNSGARFVRWIEVVHQLLLHPATCLRVADAKRELLTCDDDILPKSNLISAMQSARRDHRGSLLCTQCHFFEELEMDEEKPHHFGLMNTTLVCAPIC